MLDTHFQFLKFPLIQFSAYWKDTKHQEEWINMHYYAAAHCDYDIFPLSLMYSDATVVCPQEVSTYRFPYVYWNEFWRYHCSVVVLRYRSEP